MFTGENRLVFRINGVDLFGGPDREDLESSFVFIENTDWIHVAMTYDGVGMRIYINGALDSSRSFYPGEAIVSSSRPVHLGMRQGEQRYFDGLMDDVRIYDVALTADQISALYDADGDGVLNFDDNCLVRINPNQDDTDGDFCGNICDPDYDQSGLVTLSDYGAGFLPCFGQTDPSIVTAFGTCAEADHTEPMIPEGGPIGVADFGSGFLPLFGLPAGPSGTTPGTTACP